MPIKLILASASPRRRELLGLLRIPFEVVTSEVDESKFSGTPTELVRKLANAKAAAVLESLTSCGPDLVVLGADTVVAIETETGEEILGKPTGPANARRMLEALSGKWHAVHTGVALVRRSPSGEMEITERVVDTKVQFRELSSAHIDAYIATGEPFDKAGAYGIQGFASAFVESIAGDYFSVVGLPVSTVARMLEELGVDWFSLGG